MWATSCMGIQTQRSESHPPYRVQRYESQPPYLSFTTLLQCTHAFPSAATESTEHIIYSSTCRSATQSTDHTHVTNVRTRDCVDISKTPARICTANRHRTHPSQTSFPGRIFMENTRDTERGRQRIALLF